MKNTILFFLLCFFLGSAQVSCVVINYKSEKGSGNIITEKRTLEPFSEIQLAGSHNLNYLIGEDFTVEITADDNLMEFLTTDVDNGKLSINSKSGVSLSPSKKIQITVTAPEVSTFNLSGSGNIHIDNLVTENVSFQLSGSGNIRADIAALETQIRVAGSGSVSLKGQSELSRFTIAGSGNIRAADLSSRYLSVSISGSGSVDAHAEIELDANISGSGSIRYTGSPEVSQKISGSGKLRKVD